MHDRDEIHAHDLAHRRPVLGRVARPDVVHLASQMGNRAFTRHVVHVQRAVAGSAGRSQGAGPLDPDIAADIRGAQGGGRPLDTAVRADMEAHLGVDLSAVRVHADARGDALSRSVQADAFTTGTDVFFRSGRYAPASSDGRKLLAHELTHVVQQSSGAGPAESAVSHPDDLHEREASAVADSVAAGAAAPATASAGAALAVSRQATDDELDEDLPVSRQANDEELDLVEDEATA